MWVFNDDFWVYRLLQIEHWIEKIMITKFYDYEKLRLRDYLKIWDYEPFERADTLSKT